MVDLEQMAPVGHVPVHQGLQTDPVGEQGLLKGFDPVESAAGSGWVFCYYLHVPRLY